MLPTKRLGLRTRRNGEDVLPANSSSHSNIPIDGFRLYSSKMENRNKNVLLKGGIKFKDSWKKAIKNVGK